MKKTFFLGNFAFVAATLAMTSCGSDVVDPLPERPENPGGNTGETLKPASEYFDFVTSQNVSLNVNFGSWGANALVDLYDEFPEQYDGEATIVVNKKPLCSLFADENGRINDQLVLPAHASSIYLCANGFGLPNILELDVQNGMIAYDSESASPMPARTMMTRSARAAEREYQLWTVDAENKVYAINPWEGNRYGKVEDVNGLISKGNVTSDQISRLRYALWGGPKRDTSRDNSKWAEGVDSRALATTLAKRGIEDGVEVEYENAEVWVTFVDEYAYSQISLGYYYYPTPETPEDHLTSEDFFNLKKYIIFPNVSLPNAIPYCAENSYAGGALNYGPKNAPMTANTKCQLLFEDEEGNISTHFPAGYTIGYFIVSKLEKANRQNMLPDPTYVIPSVTSDTRRCAEGYLNVDGKYSCVTLQADEETTFFCFENQVPGSRSGALTFDDVIFTVTTTPKNIDKQMPPQPLPEPVPVEDQVERTYYTYTYEDQWPNKGDYDLNDVMVEHEREIHFNQNNEVTKVIDTFTSCQPAGAATYRNAFAYSAEYLKSADVKVTCSAGVTLEEQTGSYVLFPNANDARGKSFSITMEPKMGVALKKSDFTKKASVYDPFIIVNYVAGQGNRVEVHMPKKSCTSLADAELAGSQSDAYYIDRDGKHPFSLEIPLPVNPKEGIDHVFIPVTETVAIDSEYPLFSSWMQSNGKENSNWYLKNDK